MTFGGLICEGIYKYNIKYTGLVIETYNDIVKNPLIVVVQIQMTLLCMAENCLKIKGVRYSWLQPYALPEKKMYFMI